MKILKNRYRDWTQISPEMKLYFYAYIVGEVFGINAPILVQKFVESSNTIYINDTTKDERKILKISF